MNKQTISTSIKALTASLVTAAVLLFVFAFAALKTEDPSKNLELFAYVAILISAAVGGIFCTGSENRMISSVMFSFGFVLILIIAGSMMGEIFRKPVYSLICCLLIFVIPAAIILRSSGAKKKKNKSRKKFMRSRK